MNMYKGAYIDRDQLARKKKHNLHTILNREENLSSKSVDDAKPPVIYRVFSDNDLDTKP